MDHSLFTDNSELHAESALPPGWKNRQWRHHDSEMVAMPLHLARDAGGGEGRQGPTVVAE